MVKRISQGSSKPIFQVRILTPRPFRLPAEIFSLCVSVRVFPSLDDDILLLVSKDSVLFLLHGMFRFLMKVVENLDFHSSNADSSSAVSTNFTFIPV